MTYILNVDSSFFFPDRSSSGYEDDTQNGRYVLSLGKPLQAPLILPVGAIVASLTIYYKNNTDQAMQVAVLRKHISHHAPSEEYEVALESCPPGTAAPDDFLSILINRSTNGGSIMDGYFYLIQIYNTAKINDTQERAIRGMRIEYNM